MATILYAEDDDAMRGFFEKALEKAGHHVIACADGDRALRALGSAWVAAGVQTMVFFIQCVFVQRLFTAAPSFREIGLYVIFLICSIIIGWGAVNCIENWLTGAIILIGASLITSLILKLIKPLEMLRIIRSKED